MSNGNLHGREMAEAEYTLGIPQRLPRDQLRIGELAYWRLHYGGHDEERQTNLHGYREVPFTIDDIERDAGSGLFVVRGLASWSVREQFGIGLPVNDESFCMPRGIVREGYFKGPDTIDWDDALSTMLEREMDRELVLGRAATQPIMYRIVPAT